MTVRTVPAQFPTIRDAIGASAPGDSVSTLVVIRTESIDIGSGKHRLAVVDAGQGSTIINSADTPVFTISGSNF